MRNLIRAGLLTLALLPVSARVLAEAPGRVITFPSLDPAHDYKVTGTLYMPAKPATPCPAVVLVHGSTGLDSRNLFYRDPLLKAGIATFEVDFKTGVFTTPMDRPKAETFVPMGFAALRELRKLPAIDPARIAIMGYSLGGHLTITTAFEVNRKEWMGEEKGYAAHVGFYPVCKAFLARRDCSTTGAPILILYGTADCYGEGESVPAFKELLHSKFKTDVTTVEYPGAAHGFNRNGKPLSYTDPAAINQKGYMAWDGKAAEDSIPRVIAFLHDAFAAPH